MGDLVQAIASNDLVKVKHYFNEAMEKAKQTVLDERRKQIAESVMIEGEEKKKSDADAEENEDDDEDDSDED